MQSASFADDDVEDEAKRRVREISQRVRRERRAQRDELPSKGRPETLDRVKQTLTKQPESAEFLLSLFYTAIKSYRHATIADPWPAEFSRVNGATVEKRFEAVVRHSLFIITIFLCSCLLGNLFASNAIDFYIVQRSKFGRQLATSRPLPP